MATSSHPEARPEKKPKKDKLSNREIERLMGHDTYKRTKGGGIKQIKHGGVK